MVQDISSFVRNVGVMKPASVQKGNINALAKLDSLLDSVDYAMEEKLDGCHYKMIACRFFSKDNKEKTDNFGHLRDFFMQFGAVNLILDGEIHYPNKTSQFAVRVTGALPETAEKFQLTNGYIHYTIFDMMRTPKGTWIINQPYKERRKILEAFYEQCIKGTWIEPYVHLSEVRHEHKRAYLDELLSAGKEGGVLKHLNSKYIMGKKPMWQWMKMKQNDSADLVVMGFDPPKKEYSGTSFDSWPYWEDNAGIRIPVTKPYHMGWIGAIKLGAYVDGQLQQICTVSGMKEEERQHMSDNKDRYLGKVVRIDFMERTEAGFPRHPVFVNLHEDKTPEECTWVF